MRSSLLTFKLAESQSAEKSQQVLSTVLCQFLPGLVQTSKVTLNPKDGDMIIFSGPSISSTLRFFSEESVFVLNIDATESYEGFSKKFNNSSMTELKELLEKSLEIEVERIPLIKRDNPVPLYFMSSDDRVLEYDFDEIKFHEKSDFQDIKILHSPTFGNTLILGELQNLAEGDLAYTRGLMNFGKNSYKGKTILFYLFELKLC